MRNLSWSTRTRGPWTWLGTAPAHLLLELPSLAHVLCAHSSPKPDNISFCSSEKCTCTHVKSPDTWGYWRPSHHAVPLRGVGCGSSGEAGWMGIGSRNTGPQSRFTLLPVQFPRQGLHTALNLPFDSCDFKALDIWGMAPSCTVPSSGILTSKHIV